MATNPYQAPAATVSDPETFQEARFFSISGRIGRARYIAYFFGSIFLLSIASAVITTTIGLEETVGLVVTLAIAALAVMLAIQRAHDFNVSGWLAIVAVVPVLNLLFLVIPGTDGTNKYGAKTPPNSVPVLIVAWIVPTLFIIGILAAIALPAYNQYAHRAQQEQMSQ